MDNYDLDEILGYLEELREDMSTPKSVKNKSGEVIAILKSEGDMSLNASKAINIFEELSDDTNIEAITRTQIWHLISLLEQFT